MPRSKRSLAAIKWWKDDPRKIKDDDPRWLCSCGKRKASVHSKRCEKCNRTFLAERMNDKQHAFIAQAPICQRCGKQLYPNGNCRGCTQRGISVPSRRFDLTPEHKEALRVANMGNKKLLGHKHSAETMRRIRGSASRFNGIERKVAGFLLSIGVRYEREARIEGVGFVDFLVPRFNLIIECDGDYWHSKEGAAEKDADRDRIAGEQGFRSLRLKERDIRKNWEQCCQSIYDSIFHEEEIHA